MCSSFKGISLRSVSPPLIVSKEGVSPRLCIQISDAAGPLVQFMAGVTLWSFANCLSAFTILLLSFCVHSYEDY